MSNYTPSTDFSAKDALLPGNPSKVIRGTEISAEFSAVQTAITSKYDADSTIPLTAGGTGATSASGARVSLGLEIGTNVQAYDADISTVSASQVEMETGTEAALRSMSPLRVAQAIAALSTGGELKAISAVANTPANGLTISASALSLDFRSATLTSGAVTTVKGTPADLVISSGSTLGTVSAQPSRIVVLALNNAGTIELAAVNIAGGTSLDETGLITTVAEGGAGAADSATVIYSTTARTSVAYRVIGYVESTQATAGIWVTAPSVIQGAGGNSLQHVNAICNGVTAATTSGTSIDFTGIPSWVKRITVMLNGVSGNGVGELLIQAGNGTPETTGYTSGCDNSGGTGVVTSTSGFIVTRSNSATVFTYGQVVLTNMGGNLWAYSSTVYNTVPRAMMGGGSKTFSGVPDRVRLTTTTGDTFDAGSVNILYE